MRRKNNLLKSFILIISLPVLAGCEKKIEAEPEPEIENEVTPEPQPESEPYYLWSNAFSYKDFIDNTKCFGKTLMTDTADYRFNERDRIWLKDDTITSIIGKWKLLLDFSHEGEPVDYSCQSVTYSFAKDSTVTISSNVKDISEGTFFYYYYSTLFACLLSTPANLVIGDDMYFCQVIHEWLTVFKLIQHETVYTEGDIVWIFYREL